LVVVVGAGHMTSSVFWYGRPSMMACAFFSPIPGSATSCSLDAVLRLTGPVGTAALAACFACAGAFWAAWVYEYSKEYLCTRKQGNMHREGLMGILDDVVGKVKEAVGGGGGERSALVNELLGFLSGGSEGGGLQGLTSRRTRTSEAP
jgi:hypothetical protein